MSQGSLTIALQSVPPGLGNANSGRKAYLDVVYDYMIGATEDGKLDSLSGFVSTWSTNADSTVWTFKNRDNVTFQNGDKATAKDLMYTIQRVADSTVVTQAGAMKRALKTLAVIDDVTSVATLTGPTVYFQANFLGRIGNSGSDQYLYPQKYIETVGEGAFTKQPIGSGSFKVTSFTPDTKLATEAVASHWLYGVPRVKQVDFLAIPDEGTRIALMQTGTADISPVSKSQIKLISGNKALHVVSRLSSGAGTWRIDAQFVKDYPGYGPNPLADVRVRQALDWHAIDRDALVQNFLYGYGKPAAGGLAGGITDPSYIAHPVPKYDPAKAKQLLAEAGYPKGFEADFWVYPFANYPEGQDIMEAVVVMLENVGLKIKRMPATSSAPYAAIVNANKTTRPTLSGSYFVDNKPALGSTASTFHNNGNGLNVNYDAPLDAAAQAWAVAKTVEEYVQLGRKYQTLLFQSVSHYSSGLMLFTTGDTIAASVKIPAAWNLGSATGWQLEKMVSSRTLS